MTVRELLNVLTDVKEFLIGYGGGCTTVNLKNPLILETFGDYIVDRVYAMGEDSFEIDIAVRPIKATDLEGK